MHRFTEVYEFAARLALGDVLHAGEGLTISITLHGLQGRRLAFVDAPTRHLSGSYSTQMTQYRSTRVLSSADLITEGRQIALHEAAKLFDRFGWAASLIVLTCDNHWNENVR